MAAKAAIHASFHGLRARRTHPRCDLSWIPAFAERMGLVKVVFCGVVRMALRGGHDEVSDFENVGSA